MDVIKGLQTPRLKRLAEIVTSQALEQEKIDNAEAGGIAGDNMPDAQEKEIVEAGG